MLVVARDYSTFVRERQMAITAGVAVKVDCLAMGIGIRSFCHQRQFNPEIGATR